ncbi:helix-turn-helix domain-containing protein [Nocardia sp. CY41]|uniref:helix-turn-helix domain-containing protein n=1 Tax=Nocardia sp. CY41 TaxID=2608686 RepID=UPI001356A1F5|nr:helix-turn-helix transcriptional regulator [Nocardia sp. CY41]
MVATEVRVQRAAKKLDQKKLADLAGIPRPTLSRMERGLVAIDMEQLDRLAHAFGMTPEAFMASARRTAEAQKQRDAIYLQDGSVNPAIANTVPPSDEHMEELRRRNRSS